MVRNRDNVATRRGWPQTGRFTHLFFHNDEHVRRGTLTNEVGGIAPAQMWRHFAKTAFEPVGEVPFQLGFDRIYVARRP